MEFLRISRHGISRHVPAIEHILHVEPNVVPFRAKSVAKPVGTVTAERSLTVETGFRSRCRSKSAQIRDPGDIFAAFKIFEIGTGQGQDEGRV